MVSFQIRFPRPEVVEKEQNDIIIHIARVKLLKSLFLSKTFNFL